jgi:hypothetical protein|tara:strand:- start:311 stop:478 length:168 start_codon:yes stop_codon:yes gene_type:complete
MKKFANYLILFLILFFSLLIVANGMKSLGLYENMENMENKGIIKQETKEIKTYNF